MWEVSAGSEHFEKWAKIWVRAWGTTGITHETKPKCEIIQNGLVSGPRGTLKTGSSSKTVSEGTKAVLQSQAAEITEIALKMPIGPNAVTHMAEAKREVVIQDPDTVFSGCAPMGTNPGPHSEVNGVVKLPEPSITPIPDHHFNVPRGRPPSQPDFTQSKCNQGHKTRSPRRWEIAGGIPAALGGLLGRFGKNLLHKITHFFGLASGPKPTEKFPMNTESTLCSLRLRKVDFGLFIGPAD